MKNKYLILLVAAVVGLLGCKKQFDPPPPLTVKIISSANPKNPYSVSNMRKAFAKLLMADVKLTNNKQQKYAKGKIMFK
jgi:glutamine synthetase